MDEYIKSQNATAGIGFISLKDFATHKKLSLQEILTIAINITDVLKEIYQSKKICKNINPSNILYNSQTKKIQFINSVASAHKREESFIRNGTALAYISPEQTGRINRRIDWRADFYSLGVTLYEMITGRLPFESDDPLELVHAHIARQPISPFEIDSEKPQVLSDIIMKLMSKNAEDRYQSVYGLRVDLEKCLHYLKTERSIELFELGREDFSETFHISQKLYCREKEVAILKKVFEETLSGMVEIMLVSGYAGIGKTAVVREIQRPIVEKNGFFIEGKFDQLHRDIPYSSLIAAFQQLIRQLLSEGDNSLVQWKEKILLALGPNGKVVTEVISELELIIGVQPDIPELGPVEAQNRFKYVFQNFVRVFADPSHPLVIFLDDLQWADQASLQLIESLFTNSTINSMLLIGAYRYNEVDTTHPLMITLDQIRKENAIVNSITLSPLSVDHIFQLITESLHCTDVDAMELTALCHQKTQGNPFYLNQFLYNLYQDVLIKFDVEHRRWSWDIVKLKEQSVTENVVDFMVEKIKKFPHDTQEIIKFASCIGSQFDIHTISIIASESVSETVRRLQPIINDGLIMPAYEASIFNITDEIIASDHAKVRKYIFIHDRVQQAAYSLIKDERKKNLHLEIGRALLANTVAECFEKNVFDIVHHFNISQEIIADANDRWRFAGMNLIAGRKAKASAAFESAYRYFNMGISFLSIDCWKNKYSLALSLYSEAAEAAYIIVNFNEMEHLVKIVFDNARTALDMVSAYETKIHAFMSQNQPLKAIRTGLHILSLLGVQFPAKPTNIHIILEILRTKWILVGKKIETLDELPEMKNPQRLAILKIISNMLDCAYWSTPMLFPLFILKGLRQSIRYGNAPISSVAYTAYGIILCAVFFDFKNGYRFGLLGIKLSKTPSARNSMPRVLMAFNNFIKHTRDHIRTTIDPLLEAYQAAMEIGDIQFAAHSGLSYCHYLLHAGFPLPHVYAEIERFDAIMLRLNQLSSMNILNIYRQFVWNLTSKMENPTELVGEYFNENETSSSHIESEQTVSVFTLNIMKTILHFVFGDIIKASENSRIASEFFEETGSDYEAILFLFYDSLIKLENSKNFSSKKRKKIFREVDRNQKKLKKWANSAPMNNQHKYLIVEAEHCRIRSKFYDASNYYDQAIKLAGENKFLHEEAIANELAGRFYLEQRNDKISKAYFLDARDLYQRWGATVKVKQLNTQIERLFL